MSFWSQVLAAGPAVLAATGVGVAAGGLVYLLAGAPVPRLERLLPRREQREVRRFEVDWQALLRDADTLWFLAGAAAGALALGLSRWLPAALIWGGGAGVGLRRLVRWARRRIGRWRRLQQVAVLYEAVDLYSQLGYPIYDALQAAALLLPELHGPVQRCLRRWGQSPIRALHELGRELDIPEAEILIAVLQQGVQVGPARLTGIMADEARQLEAIRQRIAEEQIAMRPLYLSVYTGLPGFALIGILFFPLAIRVMAMLGTLRVGG